MGKCTSRHLFRYGGLNKPSINVCALSLDKRNHVVKIRRMGIRQYTPSDFKCLVGVKRPGKTQLRDKNTDVIRHSRKSTKGKTTLYLHVTRLFFAL